MSGRSHDISAAYDAVAVTPSDSTVIRTTRSLYVGVSGDVAVTMASGATVTYKSAPIGILPVQVSKVLSTGTAATNLLALY